MSAFELLALWAYYSNLKPVTELETIQALKPSYELRTSATTTIVTGDLFEQLNHSLNRCVQAYPHLLFIQYTV